jgi:hypothetical protein
MWKIMQKVGAETVVIQNHGDLGPAVAAWKALRAKSPDRKGKPAALVAAWENHIFLTHRYDQSPGERECIPENASLEDIFLQGAAGTVYLPPRP